MLRDGVTGDWYVYCDGRRNITNLSGLVLSLDTKELSIKLDFLLMPIQLQLLLQTLQRKFFLESSWQILTEFSKVWDTHTGEAIFTFQHNHIVRAVAFPHESNSLLATGGMEKKLRLFDLDNANTITAPTANGASTPNGNVADSKIISAEAGFEIGAGVHKGTIKSIVWTRDPNILVTAADDKVIRWWDLANRAVIQEKIVDGDIGSCEFTNIKPQPNDIGSGLPVLCIAAGKMVYFYGGNDARTLIKSITLPYTVASVALHPMQRKFITGGVADTWAKVYDYDSEQEIGK